MSLVAWYPLIDGSLENKGLDTTPLTLHGTVPFTNGRVRTAPTFSANVSNYYTMPPITKVNDFSICCWVKISADVSTSNWIVWQGVVSNNNRFGFIYLGGTNSIGFHIGSFNQNSIIEKDKWYHLCMTMNDTNTVVCYINGNAVGTGLYEGYSFTENEVLYLGKSKDTSEPLNGQLQDFRYYDHCLSPKEVKEVAKGLCLHLPLKGTNARPNLFKNSATMFNSTGLAPSSTACTSSPALIFDENAPCGANGKILRATVNRPDNTVDIAGGCFFIPAITGIPTLTIGQKYCVSIWARCTANNVNFPLEPFMEGYTFVKGSGNTTLTSEWKRYYAIFTATKTGSTTCFYIQAPIGASGTLEYCCPKLELLSPTPYIPNVDDTQYSDYVLDYEPDCSGNEFDATKYGGLTTSDSNGRYNTAVAFNGANTYLQGLAPTNSECKEFTIATWVKLNNVSANHTLYACRTVIGKEGVTLFYLGASGIRLDDGGATNNTFPNSTLEPDKWYHIAVTRDTTERKLYINGSFVSSVAATGTLTNMANMYQVGESDAQTTGKISNVLNGSLSDFRLYTSVLSAEDVKELYETSVSIAHNPPSLTESAYYNYVEGQKHSTFDKSKFTVVGSPTITDDGVASGFSASNYLKTNIYSNSVVDFVITLPTASFSGNLGILNFDSSAMRLLLTKNYSLVLWKDGLNAVSTISNFSPGEQIKVSLDFVLHKMTVININTGNIVTSNINPSANVNNGNLSIGTEYDAGRGFTGGQFDLKQFSITVDGKEVFSGNKTGLDVIKPDNYTVVGSPVISDDGTLTYSDKTNYLKFNNSNSSEDWEVSFVFKPKYTRTQAYNATFSGSTTGLQFYNKKDNHAWILEYNGSTRIISINLNENNYKITLQNKNGNFTLIANNLDTGASDTVTATYTANPITLDGILRIGLTQSGNYGFEGKLDLNSFKIYVDGNLVYQPCLKIPYTESKAGIDIIGATDFINPILTSNGVLGGSTFAVSTNVPQLQGNSPYLAFDGNWNKTNVSSMFHSAEGITAGDFIIYNPLPLKLSSIYIQNQLNFNSRSSASGTVYGSNDNSNWKEITTYTNDGSTREWTINLSNNNNYYKYYKIHSNGVVADSYWTISQMKLNGEVYTLGSTGIKVVDSTYLDRVKDVYDQHYLERYYTVDETTQTVYEYPLFRDSMHSYEFDEGIQASITKNGIHNATTLTEATKTSMYQNNTDTVALIEN